jgi:hypothetical protein
MKHIMYLGFETCILQIVIVPYPTTCSMLLSPKNIGMGNQKFDKH